MLRIAKAPLCVTLNEAHAYLRLDDVQDDATLASLLRAASGCCENFIAQVLLDSSFEVDVSGSSDAVRIGIGPVRQVDSISLLGEGAELDPATYSVEIDAEGSASVHGLLANRRYTVRGVAGMAETANDVPEPLRQGILALTACYFDNRSNQQLSLPTAVTALWRPFRKRSLQR